MRVNFYMCTILELRRSSNYDGFEINFERNIKSVFQNDCQFTDKKPREILESLQ